MRIAIGGIYSEASTFSKHVSRAEDFPVRRGSETLKGIPWRIGRERTSSGSAHCTHALSGACGPIDPDVYDDFESELLGTDGNKDLLPFRRLELPLFPFDTDFEPDPRAVTRPLELDA